MKSNLTNKLLSICGSADKTYGCNSNSGVTNLTEQQKTQIEAELIKHFDFERIVWMDLPSGLSENGEPIVVKTMKISDEDNPKYTGKIGYIYTVLFTPKMYEPGELYKPVKDGCVFAPAIVRIDDEGRPIPISEYDPNTFQPTQSITLTWSPEFPQDINAPKRTYEDDKQMIRDMLEKVLNNPEEYRPIGHIGCLVRYTAV